MARETRARNKRTDPNGTMIHKVDFQKNSPEDVVAFLNMNWKNTEPHVKGMDLKLAPGAFVDKSVTLAATNMRLSELVGRVAEQLNAIVIIRADSILLQPEKGNQSRSDGQ